MNEPATAVSQQDRHLLRRAVLINFAGLLGKGFWPLFLWLVSRWYGSDTLGQFTLLYAPVELLQALCSTGFVDGIYRSVARLPDEALSEPGYASIYVALRAVMTLGIALALVAWLAGGWLVSQLWHRPELHLPLVVMAAAIPLAGVTAVLIATATAMMRNEGEALIKGLLIPAFTLGIAWSLSSQGSGVRDLALAYLGAQAVGLAAAIWLFTRIASVRSLIAAAHSAPRLIDIRAQQRFGLLQGFNVMLWVGVYSVDTLLLGAFVGNAEVARYRAGSELARLLQYFRTQFSAAFVPMAGRYVRQGELARLQDLLHSLSRTMATYALLLAGILWWLAGPVLQAMVPSHGRHSDGFVSLLLAGHLVITGFALAGNTLVVAGKQRAILRSSLLMTVVNLALGAVLIPRYGLVGAAAATLVAMAVAMGAQVAALRAALRLSVSWRPLARATLLAAASYATSWFAIEALSRWTALESWGRAGAGAAVFASLFGAPMIWTSAKHHRR
jgi:O-antigen/teichoic acid export membrane protein